jgi:hypothetical protein
MDEPTRLEELRARLSQRGAEIPPVRRSVLSPGQAEAAPQWPPAVSERASWFSPKKVLLFSALFFIAMLTIAGVVLYSGNSTVSTGNIDITITGPLEVRAGEAVPVEISVSNHNAQTLQVAELIIEYPPGTSLATGAGTSTAVVAERQRLSLGEVAGGATVKRSIQPIFFGEKDSTVTLNASLEYRLADSNAIFSKDASYQTAIAAAPVMVKASLPSEANSGQAVTLKVEVSANTPTALSGQTLLVDYPPGFRFVSATPVPQGDENHWAVANVAAGQTFNVAINGVIEGQNDELKNFKISVGQIDTKNPDQLAVVYGATAAELVVQKPQLQLAAVINNATESEVVVDSRARTVVAINWGNNLNEEVVDGQLSATFTGAVLDEASVRPSGGFYQSTSNAAVWNKTTEPDLAQIAPGATQTSNLEFASVAFGSAASQIKNPTIELTLKFRAKRVSDGEWLESVVHKTIKLNSSVQFAAKAVYYDTVAANAGPLPPKVGSETTYTLTWSLLNSANDLEQVEVRAPLPPYMRWSSIVVPIGEPLEYVPSESGGGTLIWHVGYVRAGVGLSTGPREVSFKLGITPSVSQVGDAPALLGPITVSARDTFTKTMITINPRQSITTDLTADPRFHYGQGQVVN